MSFDLRRSKQTIFGQNTDFLIGELLLKAGIIKQNQLDDALKLAGNKHMQIGQMLIMARYITPKELQAALDAQAAIKSHSIELAGAIKAINLVHRQGLTFAEAAQKQSQDTAIIPTHKLGQLLLEANLITGEQFSIALQKSMAIGLPLGRILILNNVLSEALLSSALEALIKLRDGLLSREEAVAYLVDLGRKKDVNELGLAGLEEASQYNSSFGMINQSGIRLGEFFVLAGVLSETDVMNALEFSLVNERSLGEMLLEHGYVNSVLVDSALKLQSLIQTGSMDCMQAARCLNHVHTSSMNLTEAIEKVNSEAADGSKIDFQTLLLNSNVITSEGIQGALELAVNNPRILAKILTQTGSLSEDQANLMLDCHETIIQNNISQQDAAFVLDYCLQKLANGSITFVQGLQELGWSCSEPTQAEEPEQTQEPKVVQSTGQDHKITAKNAEIKPALPANPKPLGGSETFNLMPGSDASAHAFMATSAINNSTPTNSTPKIAKNFSASASLPNAAQASPTPAAAPKAPQTFSASSSLPNAAQASPTPTATPKPIQSPPAANMVSNPVSAHPPQAKPTPLPNGQPPRSASATLNIQAIPDPRKTEVPEQLPQTGAEKPADKSPSLRSLLKDDDQSSAVEKIAPTNNGDAQNIDTEGLNLSDSEKALIMQASSLTASPEEIMAAMKLAAKKDKTIQSQD